MHVSDFQERSLYESYSQLWTDLHEIRQTDIFLYKYIFLFLYPTPPKVVGILCVCAEIVTQRKNFWTPTLKYTVELRITFWVDLTKSVLLVGLLAGCPCKACAQSTGRNFEDNLMKFGTYVFFQHKDEAYWIWLWSAHYFTYSPYKCPPGIDF